MTRFHAVLIDETGCEFGATIEAEDREAAWAEARDQYPESNCVSLESRGEAHQRQRRMENHIARGGDWDDEGRPIFHYDYPDDED